MSVHGCAVVAIEGSHCAGKTTLAAALVEHYRATGWSSALVPDPARGSPLIAAVVEDAAARFDVTSQLDLIASATSALIRTAQGRQVVVVDKTIANVIAYADVLLHGLDDDDPQHQVLTAAWRLCRAWQPYDLVVRCTDEFPIDLASDPFRSKVDNLQAIIGAQVAHRLSGAGYPVVDLPAGLSTTQRVSWVTDHPRCPTRTDS